MPITMPGMIGEASTPTANTADPLQVSVIIPTLREVANLTLLIPAVAGSLQRAMLSFEIITVDDDSRDGSEAIVHQLARAHPVRMIVRVGERGLASAVVRGFSEARGAVLVCMDADLSHPPELVPALVQAILDGADFAIGSRYVEGGSTDHQWSILRRLNSRAATWLARPLTRVRDPMSGFFALPRIRFLQARHVMAIGYKIGLELLIRTGATRCVEIPFHFRNRRHHKSKLTAWQRALYLRQISHLLWFRFRRGGRHA